MTRKERWESFGLFILVAILNLTKGSQISDYVSFPNLLILLMVLLRLILTIIGNNDNQFIDSNFRMIRDYTVAIVMIIGSVTDTHFDIISLLTIIICVGFMLYDLYDYFRKSKKVAN